MKSIYLILVYLFFAFLTNSTSAFDLSGGRPFGDSLVRFFDKDMPYVLVHKSYKNSVDGDTTQRILSIFKDSLITDIRIYGEETRSDLDSLVLTQNLAFSYSSDSIKTALLSVRSNGKMVTNQKEEYYYTDSTKAVITSLSYIPGYPLEWAFKDVYYSMDSTLNLRHNNFNYIDLGNGHSFWNERFREVSFYNHNDQYYDAGIKFFISILDTTWCSYTYNTSKDSMVIEIINQKDSTIEPNKTEHIVKTFYPDGRVKCINAEILKGTSSDLSPFSQENFYYGLDSMRYELMLYDTSNARFVLRNAENHIFSANGKYKKISYFDRNGESWKITGEDFFTYDDESSAVIPIALKENLNHINTSRHSNKIQLTFDGVTENQIGILFNISGRKVDQFSSTNINKKATFEIRTRNYSSGQYYFKTLISGKNITLPILINK